MRYLTPIADEIDAELQVVEDDIWQQILKDSVDPSALAVPKIIGRITEGLVVKSFRFAADAFFIDLLRIGDGWAKGQQGDKWGYVEDLGRAVVIGGALLRLLGVAARGERAVRGVKVSLDANSKLPMCGFVAAVRAANFQGLYITVYDLAQAVGVPIEYLGGLQGLPAIHDLTPHLTKIGVLWNEIKMPVVSTVKGTSKSKPWTLELSTVQHLEKGIAANTKGDVCLVNLYWDMATGAPKQAHTVLVRKFGKGIQYIDRTGKRYRSLAEMEGAYPGIGGAQPAREMLHFPDTRVAEAARMAASPEALFALIAIRALPAVFESEVLALAPRKPPPPPELRNAKDAGPWIPGRTLVAPRGGASLNATIYFRYAVQPADTLSRIAQRAYGDPNQWKMILDVNRQVFAGMTGAHQSLDILAVRGAELLLPSVM
ncbi:LysM peptidoglycan-binding domain-containing protein [Reyranella sp. CPCC 100927]|uniref:LysM peptidoglycan-binding domain-containing protein n=1 Tax=Reyranella sp. CPCC 100927 TaxID=2599616 RepID=UPI0011B4104D|nr:hypothetical protein [Reyranella sp. CPCC 100927]TWT13851.1 hypothetical protein FQU96_08055 [Reyranella sp. CPCC 100927]